MNEQHFSIDSALYVLYDPFFTEKVLHDEGLKTQPPYYGNRLFFLRALRELHFRLNLPLKKIWYQPINNRYDIYFLFADTVTPEYVEWLHQQHPSSKYIMCYMNSVNKKTNPAKFRYDYLKLWSGDVNDCRKYGMNQIKYSGAYCRNWIVNKIRPEYDVFFVGKDKGMKRLDMLLDLKEQFESMGLKTYFHIVAEHRYDRYRNLHYKAFIPYEECLQFLGKSKSILYIGFGSQECVTIRIQESLIHQIKLITDCSWIKKYDFYNPHNIFLLGEDNLSDLPHFLNTPYESVDADILKHIYMDDLLREVISLS